jgi:hypothetical protein
LDVSSQVLEQFPRELKWWQLPDEKTLFGVVGGWQQCLNHFQNGYV